jgi:hypothetical protein
MRHLHHLPLRSSGAEKKKAASILYGMIQPIQDTNMANLIPEIFKSVQVRLRTIRDLYAARTGSNEYFELEELARESYDALNRVNKNLLRMIEIERSLNSANKLTGSKEMRMCRQLLKEIQQLSGIPVQDNTGENRTDGQ